MELEWTGRPALSVRLRPLDRDSGRWLAATFFPAYETSSWTPANRPADRRSELVRFGVPSKSHLPFPLATDGIHWGDSAVAALGALNAPVTVRWEFQGVPSAPAARSLIEVSGGERTSDPGSHRTLTPSLPERLLRDRSAERAMAPGWAVRAWLLGTEAWVEQLTTAGRALELTSCLPGGNRLGFVGPRWPWRRAAPTFRLSENEVLSVLPSWDCRIPRLGLGSERNRSSLWLPGANGERVGLPLEPEEGRHLLVLGETGMGKSSLLVDLATQAARSGGVILLDPVGDTAIRFLARIPAGSRGRVVWVSAHRSPVGLNALAECHPVANGDAPGVDRALHDLVGALRRVRASRFGETPFWGPRIEETVTLALRAASTLPRGTLAEAARLLEEGGRVPPGLDASSGTRVSVLRSRVRERPEEVEGSRRLLGEVAGNATLVRLLCEPEATWSIEESVRPGGITVISGDAAIVGETTARYLLSVYLALLWGALASRRSTAKTFLILDEAQWYFHESAGEILRMGRRYNVHLWVATQGLRSLSDSSREALLTNCADFVLFRGSPDDAREFSRWAPSAVPEQLMSLPRGHACVLIDKGRAVDGSVALQQVRESPDIDVIEAFAAASLARYPAGPREGSPGLPQCPPFVTAREVLLALSVGLGEAGPSGAIVVEVERLRGVMDPAGDAVREAGAWLGQGGWVRASQAPGRGRIWEIRGNGWEQRLEPPPVTGELDAARKLWERLRDSGSSLPRR